MGRRFRNVSHHSLPIPSHCPCCLPRREVASLKPKSRAFDKIALGVPDLQAAADRVSAYVGPPGTSGRGALVKPPFAVPGIGTRVAIIADPDGHTLALVDGADFEKELVV